MYFDDLFQFLLVIVLRRFLSMLIEVQQFNPI